MAPVKQIASIAAFLAVALIVMSATVNAQVNFSPSWGKRVPSAIGPEDMPQFQETCKIPLESIFRIQKLIQVEAQKLLRCQTVGGDQVQRKK